jgi:class 3 adenylate cyclase
MAASGLFDRELDYIHNIMKCACEILQLSSELTFIDGTPLIVRIGLHAGTVMAGVLGDKKYTFDVWGDSVNTAARMESNGQPGSIHVSDSIMNVIDLSILPQLKLLKEQKMYIKGKGEMRTALLSLEL